MTRRLHTLTVLAAIAVLTAGCNPFGASSRGRLPEDSRFAEFTYNTDGEIKVQERTDSFNERMPALGATAGHVAAANFPEGRSSLPSPDHHFWVTGVATVAPESIQKLSEGATGNNTLLPGIYPGLYQYVPQDCHFVTIPADHANTVLQTQTNDIYSDWGSFTITDFAASADCHLVVVTGEGTTG